ncbi:MAG: dTDP-4-dehydrorhamnose 3,5-epimerase family protein [Bdellovibrionales bacterium]|nr:dTDP-4-dehydrorhamnose 3,5-epimerase family protein [Bdellovibrionales bacterium]
MELIETEVPDCFRVRLDSHHDERGSFTKLFQSSIFERMNIPLRVTESFFSRSQKGVLRGLHFQMPPHCQVRGVLCLRGQIFDTVVDLRKGSPFFGKWVSFEFSGSDPTLLLIPRGCAHGFYVTSSEADLLYFAENEHQPDFDTGIHWNSVGIPWPLHGPPAVSQRDSLLPPLREFSSPF